MRFILLSLLFLSACAVAEDYPALPSSDAVYNNKTCEEILFARDRLARLYEEEKGYLPSAKSGSSLRSLFDSNVERNQRRKIKRYRKIKGQYESAVRVASKKCS